MEVSPTAGNQNNLIYQPQIELVHVFDLMKAVRAFVLDVDGVLTNNDVLVTEAGEFLRTMNVRDGQAIKWAIEKGYPVCVITGGRSEGVIKRLNALGVQQIFSGRHDKLPVFEQFIREFHLFRLPRRKRQATHHCLLGSRSRLFR